MTGSDEGADGGGAISKATSDDDMFAALPKGGIAGRVGNAVVPPTPVKSVTKIPSLDDLAWGRERTGESSPLVAAKSEPDDDQAPVIAAAAHGDPKAIAIVDSWSTTEEKGPDAAKASANGADKTTVIHSSFIGRFKTASHHGR
jgi:hypothetical protein